MLKFHPEFRFYGIGYANTIKALIDEGFLSDGDIPDIKITRVFKSNTFDASTSVSFDTLYRNCVKQALRFVVAVYDRRKNLKGFIYL